MSTISVSNITTANGTESLTLQTGNTNAGRILIPGSGSVVLSPNSTTNSITVSTGTAADTIITNATGVYVTANVVIANNLVTGNATSSLHLGTGNTNAGDIFIPSTGGIVISPNSTINAVTVSTGSIANALVINATGVHVSQNTFGLGVSTLASNGYTVLPNGLKMNWGTVVTNTISVATYVSPFTTDTLSVSLTAIGTIFIAANTVRVAGVNSTAAQVRSASTTTTNTCYYIAIGY